MSDITHLNLGSSVSLLSKKIPIGIIIWGDTCFLYLSTLVNFCILHILIYCFSLRGILETLSGDSRVCLICIVNGVVSKHF